MPHPLSASVCLAALMQGSDTPLKSRHRPCPHKDTRQRNLGERLLVKVCKNAILRSTRSTLAPSAVEIPAIENRCPSPRHGGVSPRPPTPISSTSARTLPLEFLDAVIAHHLEGDIPTLKVISLTCRHFAAKARPVLFQRLNIYLHPTAGEKRGSRLCQLLTSYRHLIPYVKHVKLFSLFSEDSDCGADRDALRVLINLPSLARIAIHGYNNRSWNLLPRNVQLAIKTSLRAKGLTGVEVYAMSEFPVYLLEGCRSLKDLTLAVSSTSCYPTTDSDGAARSTMTFPFDCKSTQHSPIYLERLALTMPTPQLVELTAWLLSDKSPLNMTRARTLHIRQRGRYSCGDHLTSVSHLLSACQTSLEELEMDAYTPGHTVDITAPLPIPVGGQFGSISDDHEPPQSTVEDMYKLIDIAALVSLRRISLTFGIQYLYDQHRHLRLLSQMFRNLGRAPGCRLEEVDLFLWVTHNPLRKKPSLSHLTQRLLGSGSWAQLDRVLSMMEMDPDEVDGHDSSGDAGATPLPGIKKLKLQLSQIQDQEEAAKLMAICLPRLTDKGTIQFEEKLKCLNL